MLAYVRVVRRAQGPATYASETRVWEFVEPGRWVNTHFHRSPADAPAAPARSFPQPPFAGVLSWLGAAAVLGGLAFAGLKLAKKV